MWHTSVLLCGNLSLRLFKISQIHFCGSKGSGSLSSTFDTGHFTERQRESWMLTPPGYGYLDTLTLTDFELPSHSTQKSDAGRGPARSPAKSSQRWGWVTMLHRYSATSAAYRVKREHYKPFLFDDRGRKISPSMILLSTDQRVLLNEKRQEGIFWDLNTKLSWQALKEELKAIIVPNKRGWRLKTFIIFSSSLKGKKTVNFRANFKRGSRKNTLGLSFFRFTLSEQATGLELR